MLFEFIKYIFPVWYFNLKPKEGHNYFPDYNFLPPELKKLVVYDSAYSQNNASLYDAAYQAFRIGIIIQGQPIKKGINENNIDDEYRFIRKYHKSFWSFYILILRILSFHNPIREFRAYFKSRNVRQHVFLNCNNAVQLSNVQSDFFPFVSIILPTLNRYKYLKDILMDLEAQNYKNFEVIIADQSDFLDELFYEQFDLDIKLLKLKEKGQWIARNTAIKSSKGSIFVFTEDDVRVKPDWLEAHLKITKIFNADISCGVFHPANAPLSEEKKVIKFSEQFASGNALVKREVFEEIGLFDRQFERQRMGDGEFGARAYLNGFVLISNPLASCIDVKAAEGGLREMGSWDGYRPKNYFGPRPIPSILYYYRRYYGNKMSLLALLKGIPPSIVPYQFKRNRIFLIIGSIISLLFFPFILLQVGYSWYLSGIKLKDGPIIDEL